MNNHRGAALMLGALPQSARELLADRGYDRNAFRAALAAKGITSCIPSKRNRMLPIPHDAALCRQRHTIGMMFRRLKDWCHVATCYDHCAHTFFFSAILVAAIVAF